jgi:hypothetical protein
MDPNNFDMISDNLLVPAERCEFLILHADTIMDATSDRIRHGETSLSTHLYAARMAGELMMCHESNSVLDELPHFCAEQLQCYHLDILAKTLGF